MGIPPPPVDPSPRSIAYDDKASFDASVVIKVALEVASMVSVSVRISCETTDSTERSRRCFCGETGDVVVVDKDHPRLLSTSQRRHPTIGTIPTRAIARTIDGNCFSLSRILLVTFR